MGTIFFGGQIPVEDWKEIQKIMNDKNANRQPKEKLFNQSDCIREGLKLFIARENMGNISDFGQNCSFKDPDDGCCNNVENTTPECTQWSCPLVNSRELQAMTGEVE